MPEMSGDQLATAIKQMAPQTSVVLLTGFGDMMEDTKEKPESVDIILGKPVTLTTLRQSLATLLAP